MGTWDIGPMDNDAASDLKDEFEETQDIALLENAFDTVLDTTNEGELVEAPDAEAAIAAAHLLKSLDEEGISPEEKQRLMTKAKESILAILENSELKDLWKESDEYEKWESSLKTMIAE